MALFLQLKCISKEFDLLFFYKIFALKNHSEICLNGFGRLEKPFGIDFLCIDELLVLEFKKILLKNGFSLNVSHC